MDFRVGLFGGRGRIANSFCIYPFKKLSTISVLELSDAEKTVMLGVTQLQVSCSYMEIVLLALSDILSLAASTAVSPDKAKPTLCATNLQ